MIPINFKHVFSLNDDRLSQDVLFDICTKFVPKASFENLTIQQKKFAVQIFGDKFKLRDPVVARLFRPMIISIAAKQDGSQGPEDILNKLAENLSRVFQAAAGAFSDYDDTLKKKVIVRHILRSLQPLSLHLALMLAFLPERGISKSCFSLRDNFLHQHIDKISGFDVFVANSGFDLFRDSSKLKLSTDELAQSGLLTQDERNIVMHGTIQEAIKSIEDEEFRALVDMSLSALFTGLSYSPALFVDPHKSRHVRDDMLSLCNHLIEFCLKRLGPASTQATARETRVAMVNFCGTLFLNVDVALLQHAFKSIELTYTGDFTDEKFVHGLCLSNYSNAEFVKGLCRFHWRLAFKLSDDVNLLQKAEESASKAISWASKSGCDAFFKEDLASAHHALGTVLMKQSKQLEIDISKLRSQSSDPRMKPKKLAELTSKCEHIRQELSEKQRSCKFQFETSLRLRIDMHHPNTPTKEEFERCMQNQKNPTRHHADVAESYLSLFYMSESFEVEKNGLSILVPIEESLFLSSGLAARGSKLQDAYYWFGECRWKQNAKVDALIYFAKSIQIQCHLINNPMQNDVQQHVLNLDDMLKLSLSVLQLTVNNLPDEIVKSNSSLNSKNFRTKYATLIRHCCHLANKLSCIEALQNSSHGMFALSYYRSAFEILLLLSKCGKFFFRDWTNFSPSYATASLALHDDLKHEEIFKDLSACVKMSVPATSVEPSARAMLAVDDGMSVKAAETKKEEAIKAILVAHMIFASFVNMWSLGKNPRYSGARAPETKQVASIFAQLVHFSYELASLIPITGDLKLLHDSLLSAIGSKLADPTFKSSIPATYLEALDGKFDSKSDKRIIKTIFLFPHHFSDFSRKLFYLFLDTFKALSSASLSPLIEESVPVPLALMPRRRSLKTVSSACSSRQQKPESPPRRSHNQSLALSSRLL